MHFTWVSMYLARKYWLGTLFLRLLLETGPPFYVVIRATRRSSHLQGKGSTYFKTLSIVPAQSNPRPPALQSSALPTELILRGPYGSIMMPQKITAACLYLETSLWRQQIFLFLNFDYVLFPLVLDVVAQAKTIAAPSAITKETVLLQVRQIYSSTIGHHRLR